MLEKAYQGLYGLSCPFTHTISFSGKFKGYNANAKRCGSHIDFHLSKKWKTVDEEITIGLIQELLMKIHRRAKKTKNMELYHIFLQKVHIAIPKKVSDPILQAAFDRVNDSYFNGCMEQPNLSWGSFSTTKLGSYDFGTDQVSISKIFHPDHATKELLAYVLYHELLHKDEKFTCTGKRTITHSKRFREREKHFAGSTRIEKELSAHCRHMRARRKAQPRPKSWFQRMLQDVVGGR